MHFHHAAGLVDVQGRHHHIRRAHHATQQALAADELVKYAHYYSRTTTDQERLTPSAIPEREAERVHKHQPQHPQHDSV